jgi:hypothetical protein
MFPHLKIFTFLGISVYQLLCKAQKEKKISFRGVIKCPPMKESRKEELRDHTVPAHPEGPAFF